MQKRTFRFRQWQLNRDLLDAVGNGQTEKVRLLLDAGADVNANCGYDTALSIAGRRPESNADTVRLLLERGAFVNGDPKRRTVNPLLRASHQSDPDRIRLLVTYGSDVNVVQPGITPGFTPLQELARWADLETLALLLKYGADINQKCPVYKRRMSGGSTALHLAANAGRADIVAFFLSKGADIAVLDARGRSPLDYAREALDQPFYDNDEHQYEAQSYRDTIALLEKEMQDA